MSAPFIHPQALVETDEIGSGTHIWAFAHVLPGAKIGNNCNVGDHGFIEGGAVVGNNVTLKNHVCLWTGVTIEDDVFIGPHAVFTNDMFPRSPRMAHVNQRYDSTDGWLERTLVQQGCSIGANATILPGITLGAYSMIAAGAVVTRDVPPHALMMGSPAKRVGSVCRCGIRLDDTKQNTCKSCGWTLPSS